MLYQEDSARQIADFLLEIKAVILRPEQPFTWASGWKSPIYCDNRLILSEPRVRDFIKKTWAAAVKELYPEANALAGVATAGIAHAAFVADALGWPMAYVRPKPKEHGTGKLIEGRLTEKDRVVVIEDLVSTGKSSLQALESVRQEGIPVEGLMSVFSYGFPEADAAFEASKVKYYTLCNYPILIEEAIKKGYVRQTDLPLLSKWRKNPAEWGK